MLIVFSAIIFLFSSIALISSNMALMASDRIFYGVHVHDVPLGGLTKDEAEKKLSLFYQQKLKSQTLFNLILENRAWDIKPNDIDFQTHITATAQKAYEIGREPGFVKRVWSRMESAYHGLAITNDISYNEQKLTDILKKIAAQSNRDSQNAYCEIMNGQVTVHAEKTGIRLDIPAILSLLKGKLSTVAIAEKINLPVTTALPEMTQEDLQGIDAVLSSYTTQFNQHNYNRSENIRIAANSINGILIRPEQVISFNDLVGLRVAEAGFKEAPVIVNGKTVPDIGGGVCQVSSTLYNAILLADLTPVERTPHFHPLGYAPIGLDATVADNLIDFKFKNPHPTGVYIVRQIDGGNLTIFVLGNAKTQGNVKITLTSTVNKTIPPAQTIEYDEALPAGKTIVKEDGIPGYNVSSYRIKTVDGNEISRELLYIDDYQSEPEVIVIGGRKKPPASSPATAVPAPAPPPSLISPTIPTSADDVSAEI